MRFFVCLVVKTAKNIRNLWRRNRQRRKNLEITIEHNCKKYARLSYGLC